MAAFTLRGAGCCIHTHSKDAVLVTLLCEAAGTDVFERVFLKAMVRKRREILDTTIVCVFLSSITLHMRRT
jgi:hypothetical protein